MVQVDGDRKMADKVARAHGMRNMGQVNDLSSDVYICTVNLYILHTGWWT